MHVPFEHDFVFSFCSGAHIFSHWLSQKWVIVVCCISAYLHPSVHRSIAVFVAVHMFCFCSMDFVFMFVGLFGDLYQLTSVSTNTFNSTKQCKRNTKIITYFAMPWSKWQLTQPQSRKNYASPLFFLRARLNQFYGQPSSVNRCPGKCLINSHLAAYCFQHFVNYSGHTCTQTDTKTFQFGSYLCNR